MVIGLTLLLEGIGNRGDDDYDDEKKERETWRNHFSVIA